MNPIFDFLIAPYENYSLLHITLELVAVVLGLVSVWFAKQDNILVYPSGMISTGIFVYLLLQAGLIGDFMINAYYFIMSIYGWYFWTRRKEGKIEHPIARMNSKEKRVWFILFMIILLFVGGIYTFCLTNGKIGRHLLTPLPQHYFLLECGLWQEKK